MAEIDDWIGKSGGPNVQPIQLIHRGLDSYVSFHRKEEDGAFVNLWSVKAEDLRMMFPQLVNDLLKDSFFSIHSFYRGGFGESKLEGLPRAHRQTKDLRYLNACFSDLDAYKEEGIEDGHLIGQIIIYQDHAIIPPASLIVRSGRGVWCLWLLRDPKASDNLPVRAFPRKLILWNDIQHAIAQRLRNLGADALDAARIMRVPGSIHTGVGRPVAFLIQKDAAGQPYLYTLEEMAKFLDVKVPEYHPAVKDALTDKQKPPGNRWRGYQALYARRVRDFKLLQAKRGGFQEGCRNRACLLFASFLRKIRMPEPEIREHVLKFAKQCHPPLSQAEALAALREAMKPATLSKIKDSTIGAWLRITPEENEQLEGTRYLEPEVALERKESRVTRMEGRREAILRIREELKYTPTVREAAVLLAERGHEGSYVTVFRDYKALGLKSNAAQKQELPQHPHPQQQLFV